MTRPLAFMAAFAALAACATSSELAIDVDATSIDGTFVHDGSAIAFRSVSTDQLRASLHLDVDGVAIDVELDLDGQTFSEDGHSRSLYEPELAALLALRDALITEHAELMNLLQGALLIREVDRLAEAPLGLVLDRHVVSLKDKDVLSVDADGCGDDGVTCLSGTSGGGYAVYDPGTDGTCAWSATTYGGSQCYGRCGAGCNWLDNDYTWDCLDHDRCLDAYGGSTTSGNVNCGDEFWDAADDYVVTYAPYCWSGSSRTPPTPPPPPVPALVSITVAPAPIAIDRQQRVQLRAIGAYGDGSSSDLTATATWTTSAAAVATVAGGAVDGQSQSGTATITATVGAVAGAAAVTVSERTCHVVINEVQAGGATAADEWIELHNSCTVAIPVDGWTVVYRAASTTGATDVARLVTLAGTVAPGAYRVYSSASAPPAITAIATATWTHNGGNGALQGTSAGVALRAGPISTGPLVDAVAYGTVATGHPFAEGAMAAPALANGRSVYRAVFDGRDSNVNAADLVLGTAGAATPNAPND